MECTFDLGSVIAAIFVAGSFALSVVVFGRQKLIEARMTAKASQLSGLHQRRADVVADLYAKLARTYQKAQRVLQKFDWQGAPTREERFELFRQEFIGAVDSFRDNRIFLSEGAAAIVEKALGEIHNPVFEFSLWGFGEYSRESFEKWTELSLQFANDAQAAMKAVEKECREIVGVADVDPPATSAK